jgi:hypothetical protein
LKLKCSHHRRPPFYPTSPTSNSTENRLETRSRSKNDHSPLLDVQTIPGIRTHKTERPLNHSPTYLTNLSVDSQWRAQRNSPQPTQTQLPNHTRLKAKSGLQISKTIPKPKKPLPTSPLFSLASPRCHLVSSCSILF